MGQWVLWALAQWTLTAIIRRTRYEIAPGRQPITPGDLAVGACWALAGVVATQLSVWGGLVVAALNAAVLALLWLDAVMYNLFSFELALSSVPGVAPWRLYLETVGMARARRWFRRDWVFCTLPLWGVGLHGVLALGAVAPGMACLAPTWLALAAQVRRCGGGPLIATGRGSLLGDFAVERPLPVTPVSALTPDEEAALARSPAPYRPSDRFGLLSGRSLLLLSFESVARVHMRAWASGRAPAELVDVLLPRSVRTSRHLCTAPLTEAAHLAWYYGRDDGVGGGYLPALKAAGYTCVYLTAEDTSYYGLGHLLARAGFDRVVDGPALGVGRASDRHLPEAVEQLLAGGLPSPWFLHVHLSDTHLPYRVDDPSLLLDVRPGEDEDLRRFLRGVEEAGQRLTAVWERLRSQEPLLVVTSDHGQSFGEGGYWTHASSLGREQIDLPLLVHHHLLPPAELPPSTHHDILPTMLDLVGVRSDHPGLGDPIFHLDRPAGHLLWDGKPIRRYPRLLGLALPGEKIVLDRVRDTCTRQDYDDGQVLLIEGPERARMEGLLARLAAVRGV